MEYKLLTVLGAFNGLGAMLFVGRKMIVTSRIVVFVFLVSGFGHFFGSRSLVFLYANSGEIKSLNSILTAGSSQYGGLLTALALLLFLSYAMKTPVFSILTLYWVGFFVAGFWGRMGCIFADCCGGKLIEAENDFFWGLQRYPAQTISIALFFIGAVGIFFLARRQVAARIIVGFGLVFHGLSRGGISFIRVQDSFVGESQVSWTLAISIFLLAVGLFSLVTGISQERNNFRGEL